MDTLITRLKAARRAGAPLVHIETPDQPAMMHRIIDGFRANGEATVGIIGWSPVDGLSGANPIGVRTVSKIEAPPEDPREVRASVNLVTALSMAARFDEYTILVVPHAIRAIEQADLPAIAGLLALRDPYKATHRTVVTLAPGDDGKPRIFRDSLVSNLADFLDTLSARNIAGDTSLNEIAAQARSLLAGTTPAELRTEPQLRWAIGAEMAQIKAKLDAMIIERPARRFGGRDE